MSKKTTKKNKKKKKMSSRNLLMITSLIIAAILIGSGIWLKTLWDEIYDDTSSVAASEEHNVEGSDKKESSRESLPDIMNVMILGLDSRDRTMRADTIMLLVLNRATNEINIVSIPRDMRVNLPGRGPDKINHAYAFGEVALTRDALEDFLDVKIDHYMTTDFDGFKNIVDIMGGIELEVDQRMRYYGIDVTIELDPGLQVLDGNKALQYVRYRSDGRGDLGRVERQQKFVKTFIQEILTFKNILKIPRLLPELAENIKTDLELNQAIMLANKLKNIEFDKINTTTLPGTPRYIEGISYVLPDEEGIQDVVNRYIRGIQEKQS